MSRPNSFISDDSRGTSFIVPMPDTVLHRNLNPPNPHVNVPHSTRQHRYSDLVELGDYRHPQTSPATSYNGSAHSASGARRDVETELGSQQRNPRYLVGSNMISQLGIHEQPNQSGLGRSVSIGNGNGTGRSGSSSRMAYSPQTNDYSPIWNERAGSQQYQSTSSNVLPPPMASNMRRGMSHDVPPQSTPQASLVPISYAGARSSASSRVSGDWSSIGSVGGAATSLLPSTSMFPEASPTLARHDSYSPSHYAASQSRSIPPPSSSAFYASQSPSTSTPAQSHRQAQPQPQQYYQSQQYLDSKHASSLASASSSRLPPPNQSSAPSQYYGGPEVYSSTPQRSASTSRTRTNGFRRVRDIRDIETLHNSQPSGRRGDPEAGGFISPLKALTTHLPDTYRLVNPSFRYETSLNPRRVLTKPSKPAGNDGFDNEDSDYILYVNDILGPDDKEKYLILDVLGQGTFGQVVKCQNMDTHEIVAVKVVKNKPAYFQQSMMEVTILELINNTFDKDDEHHMLRLKDTFIHHSHLCLVFELLSNNLYELIKQNSFRGLSTSLVRVFTAQLLDALTILEGAAIIHCDLKPENILLKSLQSPTIKVIDFGSACHERQTIYTYIQSRFYRSPEVILSLPYSASIDMWSLGCICVELFLGLPLFPGTSEFNQITRIVDMLGMPPTHMLEKGKQTNHFFEYYQDEYGRNGWRLKSLERYSKDHQVQEQPSKKYFSASTLPEIIKQYPMSRKGMKEADAEKEMNNRVAFIDFVQGLLHLDPAQRWSPQQARLHPFVLGEPLLQPFVPPPMLKNGTSKSMPASPQLDQNRAYGNSGNLRGATRIYDNSAAFNQQTILTQGYNGQAQRPSQTSSSNSYNHPEVGSYNSNNPATRNQSLAVQQQHQQMQQQHQQRQQQQAAFNSFNYGQPNYASGSVTNPPPVHYSTRGRSNTLTQELPPSLQKFNNNLGVHAETGQSVTPVLRRDDWQAWERINGTNASGMARRISVGRHPQLDFLQEQAESGVVWASPHRSKPIIQPASFSSFYPSPTQAQQPFSVVVDSRARAGSDAFDPIAPPPQAYGSNNSSNRYAPYSTTPISHNQNQNLYDPFDSYDRRESIEQGSTMFAPPLQPFQQLSPGTRSGPLPPLTTNQAWPTNVPVPRNANGAEGWSR